MKWRYKTFETLIFECILGTRWKFSKDWEGTSTGLWI